MTCGLPRDSAEVGVASAGALDGEPTAAEEGTPVSGEELWVVQARKRTAVVAELVAATAAVFRKDTA